jgi:hypothetical protein
MVTNNLQPYAQERAETLILLLHAIEVGSAPTDWIEQLDALGVGSYGARWPFSRMMAAKGCEVRWLTNAYLRPTLELHGFTPPVERQSKKLPFGRPEYASNWDAYIFDCLETAARIAFVQGFRKAAVICVEAAYSQAINPTIRATYGEPGHECA